MSQILLDLFCGAGGAAKGYSDAGFEVVGIDVSPQPRYPYTFIRADAIEALGGLADDGRIWGTSYTRRDIVAIHASPPCQHWSAMAAPARKRGIKYPELIEPTRRLLRCIGKPYVIENVPGAPLINPRILCGSQFGLTAQFGDLGKVGLRRHRLFESSFEIPDAGPHDHSLPTVTVVDGSQRIFGELVPLSVRQEAMQIDWMNRDELGESIPPAYTEYVGMYLKHSFQVGTE